MPKHSDFRVLSIQSHVVSGYVGNKSACFPLQVLGFEVDTINSVQLSNHTGYKHWKGQMLNSSDLEDLFLGLKLNGLHHYTHLLTGYVGTTSFLKKILEVVKELKEVNPELYFVCDPVMGDNGKMYVPEDLLPVYRDHLIPMANLITPNQFEAELLTGISIKNEDDIAEAMNILHNKGVETVVISSANLGTTDTLTVLGSSVRGNEKTSVRLEIPYLPSTFLGTGDLFAAVLLAWMAKSSGDLKSSCEKAVNTVQSVLIRTLEYAEGCQRTGEDVTPDMMELKIIQSKEDIENPKTVFSSMSNNM